MLQSMTAFARAQTQIGPSILCWEMKSVNHRYLDISFRLPEAFRFLEPNLRQLLRGQVNRGKLECQLKLNDSCDTTQPMAINEELVTSLLAAGDNIAETHCLPNDLTVSRILFWPGVIQVNQTNLDALGQSA